MNEDLWTECMKSDWAFHFLLYKLSAMSIASLEANQVEVVADVGEHIQEEEVKDHAHVPANNVVEHISTTVKGLVEISGEHDQEHHNGEIADSGDTGNY